MATTAPVTVSFMNELSDHLEAQRLLYNKGAFAKADKVVALLLLGFGLYMLVSAGFHWWTIIWFPLAILEWFNLLSLEPLKTKMTFRRNPKFREKYSLTFSPENIHFKTTSIDSVLQWTHYERVVEGPTLFLLMYGRSAYTLIPKSCFSSEAEMEKFRSLLNQVIPV